MEKLKEVCRFCAAESKGCAADKKFLSLLSFDENEKSPEPNLLQKVHACLPVEIMDDDFSSLICNECSIKTHETYRFIELIITTQKYFMHKIEQFNDNNCTTTDHCIDIIKEPFLEQSQLIQLIEPIELDDDDDMIDDRSSINNEFITISEKINKLPNLKIKRISKNSNSKRKLMDNDNIDTALQKLQKTSTKVSKIVKSADKLPSNTDNETQVIPIITSVSDANNRIVLHPTIEITAVIPDDSDDELTLTSNKQEDSINNNTLTSTSASINLDKSDTDLTNRNNNCHSDNDDGSSSSDDEETNKSISKKLKTSLTTNTVSPQQSPPKPPTSSTVSPQQSPPKPPTTVITTTSGSKSKNVIIVKMDQPAAYVCMTCKAKFSSFIPLKEHMKNSRECKRVNLTCETCGKLCETKKSLYQHGLTHREKDSYVCDECGKTYSNRFNLENHKSSVHGEQIEEYGGSIYKCKTCDDQFTNRTDLYAHINNHTKLSTTHLCDTCGKCCSSLETLRSHIRIHLNIRPFPCSFCDKRFRSRLQLTQHLHVHTGIKPFVCTFPDCGKSFAKKGSLTSHERLHSGEMYECLICLEKFSSIAKLKTHSTKFHN